MIQSFSTNPGGNIVVAIDGAGATIDAQSADAPPRIQVGDCQRSRAKVQTGT